MQRGAKFTTVASGGLGKPRRFVRWAERAQNGFVLWVLLGAAWGYLWPQTAAPMQDAIPGTLAAIMLGMGLTLAPKDVADVRYAGRPLALGVALQFVVMPLAAWVLARLLGLPAAVAIGLILLGAAPGGTASNVVTFLARGDVALSVAMTTASTLLSPILTPWWVGVLAATWLKVEPWPLLLTTAQLVLVPVLLGAAIRAAWRPPLWVSEHALPLAAMAAIAWIVGVIVALNVERLFVLPLVIVAVMLHNMVGLAAGYAVARLAGIGVPQRRAIAIEVGMQNSGLAVALALKHVGPEAALAGAIFSIWHNITGPALAALWRRFAALPRDGRTVAS